MTDERDTRRFACGFGLTALALLAGACSTPGSSDGETAQKVAAAGATPAPRAVTIEPVAGTTRLPRGEHPLAKPQFDQGRLDPTKRLANVSLVFRPTPEQERDRQALVDKFNEGDGAHRRPRVFVFLLTTRVGGVGINLAIQDAVATANILARPLRRRKLSEQHLAAVQRRREFATAATQAVQVAIHNAFAQVFENPGPVQAPWQLKLAVRIPGIHRAIGYVVGMGVRPEHVRPKPPSPVPFLSRIAILAGRTLGTVAATLREARETLTAAPATRDTGTDEIYALDWEAP